MINIVLKDKQAVREIGGYISLLKKNNVKIQQVILFGSFAKNKEHEDSDIDLAIISNDFNKDQIHEMMFLKKLSVRVSDRIEPIPLTKEDMKLRYHSLIGEIKKYGKIIYEN